MKIKMTDEQCKSFIDKVFINALDVDFDYVVQAVKEKIERDARINSPSRENPIKSVHTVSLLDGKTPI